MNKTNPKVDAYFEKDKKWREELGTLRKIVLESGLTEELKWYQPCYTLDGKNVLIVHRLKDSCALAFLKGALMKDPKGLLIKPGENTQSGRWIKFTSLAEIAKLERTLKSYIREAMAVEKAGLEVDYKKTSDYEVPAELSQKFKEDAEFRKAFAALTPGRQRGYLLYFGAATQAKTRESRIEKYVPQILEGKGFHDDYKAKRKK